MSDCIGLHYIALDRVVLRCIVLYTYNLFKKVASCRLSSTGVNDFGPIAGPD